ncbi:MAG: VWA domain-containing protein [Acidimicrobiia bacterium]|nr:VWA domain-containing protein [Acidimicrobiia bacterium]
MIGALTSFVDELREVGVPVSMVEAIDAATAIEHIDLANRQALRSALAATLVKQSRHMGAFDAAFEVFFGTAAPPPGAEAAARAQSQGTEAAGGSGGDGAAELMEAIAAALQAGDDESLRALVRQAVSQLSGLQPGRPVGGRYYFYRVMQRLGVDQMRQQMLDAVSTEDDLGRRIAEEDIAALLEMLEEEVRSEVIRRLVADRGAEAVARTLRSPLLEDVDLMHATREELARIEHAVGPLARKLATRLAQRRRHGQKGRLDVRRTIRRSLQHGGVLLDPSFKPPRKTKPELVLLCDVSGSMATFARFTLQLTFSLAAQFSNVKVFAFVDALDDVTRFFGPGRDLGNALNQLVSEARIVWQDGHSDYGHALDDFVADHLDKVTPRSTVLVTGDARSNYRDPNAQALAQIAEKARALYWLNPEAQRYWNTGDSVMAKYVPYCDSVREVRTIRQLERFVEDLILPATPGQRAVALAH